MNKILKIIVFFIFFILTFVIKSFSKYNYTQILKAYELTIRKENTYNNIERYNNEDIQIIQIIR